MSLASVSLNSARNFLNDTGASLWDDATLIPFLNIGYRILQTKLKNAGLPFSITELVTTPFAANTAFLVPTRIIEPILVWDKLSTDPVTAYLQVTRFNSLPPILPGTSLKAYQWDGEQINFISATTIRSVKVKFFQFQADITSDADNITFINNENYLAPMTASLAYQSVGEADQAASCVAIAEASLTEIINSNTSVMIKSKM